MDAVSSGHADISIYIKEKKNTSLTMTCHDSTMKRGEIISFKVETGQHAVKNRRHMKLSAQLWHSLLTLQTPVLLLLLSAPFSFLFFPPLCMAWPLQLRLGWIVQFHTCLPCWHFSAHIFPTSRFPLTLFCISSIPIRCVSSPLCEGGTSGRCRAPVAHVLRRATGFSLWLIRAWRKEK